MYKQDLALNNLQGLICHKNLTNQPTNYFVVCIVHEIGKPQSERDINFPFPPRK